MFDSSAASLNLFLFFSCMTFSFCQLYVLYEEQERAYSGIQSRSAWRLGPEMRT